MFPTSRPEQVNREFDTKQECRNQNGQRYGEPVHDSREPLFCSRARVERFLYSRQVNQATAKAEPPKIVAAAALQGRVLQGLWGTAEQKGHRGLSGTTRIAGILDLGVVVIYLGRSRSFDHQRTFKGTSGTKIQRTICYRIEEEYCQGSGRDTTKLPAAFLEIRRLHPLSKGGQSLLRKGTTASFTYLSTVH